MAGFVRRGAMHLHPNTEDYSSSVAPPHNHPLSIHEQTDQALILSPLSFESHHLRVRTTVHRRQLVSPPRLPAGHHVQQPHHYHQHSSGRRSLTPQPAPRPIVSPATFTPVRTHQGSPSVAGGGGDASPRRRSLPPNFRSPKSRAPGSRGGTGGGTHRGQERGTGSPPLWSVPESWRGDEEEEEEPMDISPTGPPQVRPAWSNRPALQRHPPDPRPPRHSSPVEFAGGSFIDDQCDSFLSEICQENLGLRTRRTGEKQGPEEKCGSVVNGEETPQPVRSKEDNEEEEVVEGTSCLWCTCKFLLVALIMILGVVAGAGLVAAFLWNVDVPALCRHHQTLNTTSLSESLRRHVYGQHIAVDLVPAVLEEHFAEGNELDDSLRPLVISFHGWTGVGKNYVSLLMSKHLRSSTANKIICPLHFPHDVDDYREELKNMILKKLSICTLNLFIVDEIDKAPLSVVEALRDVLLYMRSERFNEQLLQKEVVIVLISNTGGSHINEYVYRTLRTEGRRREEITHEQLREVLLNAAVYEGSKAFEWFNLLNDRKLIDAFVPFLPLQEQHVRQCVAADIEAKGMVASREMVDNVLKETTFMPEEDPIFSASGCRQVPSKVDVNEL